MFPKVMMTVQLILQMDILTGGKWGIINSYAQHQVKDKGQTEHISIKAFWP